MIQLPTLDEAETRIMQGGDTPLDRMISEHQPVDTFRAHHFRVCLTQVLQQFDRGVPRQFRGRPTILESLLRLLLECVALFFISVGVLHSINTLYDWIMK